MVPTQDSRRINVSSEQSVRTMSPTFEQDLADNLQLLTLLESVDETIICASSPSILDHELNRMLSLHSQISTTSTAAEEHQAAQVRDSDPFTKIGAGACGAVFAQQGRSIVAKLAKTDEEFLWNDYKKHDKIAQQFR